LHVRNKFFVREICLTQPLPAVIANDMNAIEKGDPVIMTRANLDDLPEFALPPRFSLRWYQPGDEKHWLRIHRAADHFNEFTPELFQGQFAGQPECGLSAFPARPRQPALSSAARGGPESALQELVERQCYLLAPKGEVIGTGTAWFNDNFAGGRWGRVHWLALVPEFQGRGLGKALMSAICRRLRELHQERAYLTTSTARIPAISLYLQFGFEPMLRGPGEEAVWQNVLARARWQK
jgi:GNAT superfamily N-acetyltransferase